MTRRQQQRLCVGTPGPETLRDLRRTFVLVIDEGAKTVLMSTAANFDTNYNHWQKFVVVVVAVHLCKP